MELEPLQPPLANALPEIQAPQQEFALNNEVVKTITAQLEAGNVEALSSQLLKDVAERLNTNAERDAEGNVLRFKGDDFYDEKRNEMRHAPVSQRLARMIVVADAARQANPEKPESWLRAAENERILSASAKTSLTPSLSEAVAIAQGKKTLAEVVSERRTEHQKGLDELVAHQAAEHSNKDKKDDEAGHPKEAKAEDKPAGTKAHTEKASAEAQHAVEIATKPGTHVADILKTLAANPQAIEAMNHEQRQAVVSSIAEKATAGELKNVGEQDVETARQMLDGFINRNETAMSRRANELLHEAFELVLGTLSDEFVAAYMAVSELAAFKAEHRDSVDRVTLFAGAAITPKPQERRARSSVARAA